MISLASDDKIEFFKLIRLFERFPWELKNYIRYKRTASYETNFAVSYVSYPLRMQTVAIYYIPYILNAESTDYDLKYSPHAYELRDGVPLLKIIGSHIVKDATEVAYAFQTFGDRKMLFTDIDGYNITELTISSNLTLTVDGMPKPK